MSEPKHSAGRYALEAALLTAFPLYREEILVFTSRRAAGTGCKMSPTAPMARHRSSTYAHRCGEWMGRPMLGGCVLCGGAWLSEGRAGMGWDGGRGGMGGPASGGVCCATPHPHRYLLWQHAKQGTAGLGVPLKHGVQPAQHCTPLVWQHVWGKGGPQGHGGRAGVHRRRQGRGWTGGGWAAHAVPAAATCLGTGSGSTLPPSP